jgi:valyl-tRNA synthetase
MLYRKNVVKSVLSAEIAKQTNAWHKEDLNTAAKEVYSRLKPVNVDLITEYTNFISSQHTQLLNFLKNNKPNKYIELVYEELYSEDSEKNVQTITEICEFLNIAKPEMEFIDKYMKVSNAKVNNSEQYKMIPNFVEISRKFSV